MLARIVSVFHWLHTYWELLGLTAFIGTGIKALKMWFDLRKAKQDLRNSQLEGQRLSAEVAKLTREKAIHDGSIILARNVASFPDSGCTARRILPKSEWARLLPDPNLVDDVLKHLGAVPMPVINGKEFWMVDLVPVNSPLSARRA